MLLFNRYEYNPGKDLIGKGGFSRVYKGFDRKLENSVAVKLYKTNDLFGNRITPSLTSTLLQLDHPHIVKYIDVQELEREDGFGEIEKVQICITELVNTGNIKTFFESVKDLSSLKHCIADAIEGINYLHQHHIIHGHIKPENILISSSDNHSIAKISDFGFGPHSDAESFGALSLTVAIPYLAPEQLNPEKYGINEKISFNIDVWLLGLSVYEIISGEPLFRNNNRESSEQVMKNILEETLPEKINTLPEPFQHFVKECLIKDARKRPQNITDLLYLLRPKEKKEISEKKIVSGPLSVPDTTNSDETMLISSPGENIDATQVIFNNAAPPLPGKREATDENTIVLVKSAPSVTEKTISVKDDSIAASDTTQLINPVSEPNVITVKTSDKKNNDDTVVLPTEMREGSVVLFNRYEYLPVTDLIGRGGFSRVYKAYDKKLNRWVALKIYKTNDLSDRYSPFAEIRRVINLDHSNICRYLDLEEMESVNPFGETEKIQVCVMELLDGGNIAEYYKTHQDQALLKKLLLDILQGLSYLHKKGIIHRDIKPANILIKETMEGAVAKITDFGISKVSDSVNSNSSSALIVSIPFMAPEQFNARKYGIDEKISFNLDLWSLGVTVYEIFTGKVLFKDNEQDNSEQIMANIMAPELPSKINMLPEPFKSIVSRCLVKNARDRVKKAEDLIALLESKDNERSPTLYIVEAPDNTLNDTIPEKKEKADDPSKYSFSNHSLPGNGYRQDAKTQSHTARRSFIIDETEEDITVSSQKEKPGNKKKLKTILIAAAGVILLLIYFLFIRKYMNQNAITNSSTKSHADQPVFLKNVSGDSLTNTARTIISDTALSLQEALQENEALTEKNNTLTNKTNTTTQRKKEKPGLQKVISRDKILIVSLIASESCKIAINDQTYPELEKGATLKVHMQAGSYFLKAISKSGKEYGKSINVLQRDLGGNTAINIAFH